MGLISDTIGSYMRGSGVYDSDSPGQRLMLGGINAGVGLIEMPWNREVAYQLNNVLPNVVPDPQTILGLYYAGRINVNSVKQLLAYNGINYYPGTGEAVTETAIAWHHAIDLAAPRFGIEQIRHWYRMGAITRDQANDTMKRHGFTRGEDQTLFLSEPELMDVPSLLQMLKLGIITRDEFRQYLTWLGIPTFWAGKLEESLKTAPSVGDSLAAYHRRIIGAEDLSKYLKWNGFTQPEEQQTLVQLSLQIPPPQDLVLFSVREVWNEDVVNRFGYNQEFPEAFKYWMKKQGYDWSEDITLQGGGTIPGVSWPEAYWRAHWKPISPDQAYTMLHRLRGNPDDPTTWRVPGVRPFTIEDVRTVLKVQDTPPLFRDQLAAISYLPLRLVDIRNALARRVPVYPDGRAADRDWAIEQFMDRGHNLRDATTQANMAVVIGEERQSAPARLRRQNLNKKWIDQILVNYRDGMFSPDDAISALAQKGISNVEANELVTFEDTKIQHQIFIDVVNQIKRDYLSGRIDEPDANNRLRATGMVDAVRNRYMGAWNARKSEGHVFATAAKAVEFYKRGFLTYEQAERRLRGLGLWSPDAFMLLAAAQQDMDQLAAKALDAQSRQRAAQARELQRLADQHAQAEAGLRAQIKRLTPPSKVQMWLRKGVVGRDWAESRLRAMGFPPDIVANYIAEATQEVNTNGQADE